MNEAEKPPIDAYRYPQNVRPGCQHMLGCKCAPPYWLRDSTPDEEVREKLLKEGTRR